MTDDDYMARALALAERGRGRTTPNPMVGAIVVTAGVVVGRGCHEAAGLPHAEVRALEDAGARACGGTLYCTLEPCCHRGRTGPCAERVVEAGIERVVAAMEDPHPLVRGGGFRFLRDHGVAVDVGPGGREARRLNEPFLTVIDRRRPLVTVKAALSLDGRVSRAPGTATRLTGPDADRLVHLQRAEVDAVAVGSGTVLADDPRLTPRGAYRLRPLTRVVFDRRLRTPPEARLLSTLDAGPVIIVTSAAAVAMRRAQVDALSRAGATLLALEQPDVVSALAAVTRLDVSWLLVEGGPTLHEAFWRAGVVDRLDVWVTPGWLGPNGPGWLPPRGSWRSTDIVCRSTIGRLNSSRCR